MLTKYFVTILFVIFCSRTQCLPRKDPPVRLDEQDGRLSTTLVPYHYNLELLPYVYFPQPPLPFNGKVSIYFECVTNTDVITINSDDLTIVDSSIMLSVSPDTPGNPPLPAISSWESVESVDFLNFYLDSELVAGERYILSMDFTGEMNPPSQGQGLYWDSYVNENGTTVYIAATQMESIFARMAFPCFDEPDMKATFNTTVVRRSFFQSFCNTPLVQTEARPDDWYADVYAQSPVMSSYQVCIVVGDFREIFAGTVNGYDVRILARPQMVSQMEFAANMAAETQAWLEMTTAQAYPLPKMDHIALPSKGGAMENWGLITYGEESMAVNPETSPANAILNVASIVSHELAHQWYGNLVTCGWWTDIWLNEGFATYYNYYPTVVLGWEPSENQQSDARRGTMQFLDVDCKNNSDPVRKNISTSALAPSAFSGSTYPKGGAMLRMINAILTNETFVMGLQKYLAGMAYQGATTDQLWGYLNQQAADDGITNPDGSPLDMKARMDPWLNQMGYPLVSIARSPDGTAVASRTQFLNPRNQIMNTPSEYNYAWDVPLTVVTSQSMLPEAWDAPPIQWIDLNHTQATLTGLPSDLNEWVIINSKGRMFYRVNYDDDSRAAITNQLAMNHRVIEGQTRAMYIDDQFALARTGYIPETAAMDATVFLADEYEYNPWYSAKKYFDATERLIENELWFSSYSAYVLSLSAPVYSILGWDYFPNESPIEQYLRRDMISLSCYNGYTNCVDTALQQYYSARNNPSLNVVNPNNLPTVLCTGIQTFSGDWSLWFDEYTNRIGSQIRDERYAYLYGLACTTNQPNLQRFLNELIGSGIASRDKNTAAGYLALNNYGALLLWDYLNNNWDNVPFSGRFTTLETITEGFSTQQNLDQLTLFIQNHPATNSDEENRYTQMVLTVQQNIEWLNNNRDGLADWVSEHTANADPAMLAERMKGRLTVNPSYHWKHVMYDEEDSLVY